MDPGADESRTERRDAHVLSAELKLVKQALGDSHHRELARAVGTHPRNATKPRQRTRVDDVALVLFEEDRHEGVDAVDHAVDVDAHDPVPHLLRRSNGRATSHARVVEDHVRGAELRECCIAKGQHVGFLAHVANDPDGVGALAS